MTIELSGHINGNADFTGLMTTPFESRVPVQRMTISQVLDTVMVYPIDHVLTIKFTPNGDDAVEANKHVPSTPADDRLLLV